MFNKTFIISLLPASHRVEITNRTLLEEASGYTTPPLCSLFFLGKRDLSSSSSFLGLDRTLVTIGRGSDRGCVSKEVVLLVMDLLRVILADGRETEGSGFSTKELGVVEEALEDSLERTTQEDLEEGEETGTHSWSSSCLAKFSHCIGMLMEGFEGEILTLLKMMKERKDHKGKLDDRKRKKLESSRFERELRKLECTVNYIGEGGEGGATLPGLDEDSNAFLECKRDQ